MPEHAHDRARELDARLVANAASVRLPSFKEVLAQIRVYLLKQDSEIDRTNNVYKILREEYASPIRSITLGPQFDKGPTDSHYYLKSGARLSFGISFQEGNSQCSLVAYRFHLHLGSTNGPAFYRFDLNSNSHDTPLLEPRSHVHPGSDEVRLPFPPLSPLEILDRIFQVIGPRLLENDRV
jgi:hypothetical protein